MGARDWCKENTLKFRILSNMWAPCHTIIATPLLIAFELLLCIYLESIYVNGFAAVNLKIVFLPLLAFEITILMDNFRQLEKQTLIIVPPDLFGPILVENDPDRNQGVLDRMECRQWGAHLPHVAGIPGQADYGAQSVALSGGYEDDEDHSEWFPYTGRPDISDLEKQLAPSSL
ncbi:hypothetical protein HYC85_000761 [Camellia sinensis]|uniref:YDG domain-containing protein n=1 Tax=Camellia sinensis TaxID=4442 RepID=A0A7J7I3E5_CAMSI|nr:hypothetical protein HYC85_000761 [Camellia sinensis]